MSDTATKLVRTIAMFASAMVAQKVLGLGWRAITGHKMPEEDDEDSPLGEIVIAAAVVGALTGIVRAYTGRSATKIARRRG